MTYFSGCFLNDIIKAIGGHTYGRHDEDNKIIKHLLIDSRMLVIPESTIFFALSTNSNDGHNYISELYKNGVRVFVVSKTPDALESKFTNAVFIEVKDTLSALQKLARYHRRKFNFPVLAITGSNGKTIVKEWLFQLLNDKLKIVRSPKSYNSQIGVPLSVWQMDKDFEMGIFEAGISTTGEMGNIQNTIMPDYGIFTNIGPAHDEGFKNKKEKIKEKLKLFKGVKKLIYCSDYKELHKEIVLWNKKNKEVELCPWSSHENCPAKVTKIKKTEKGTMVDFLFQNKLLSLFIPFHDAISIENALHCATFLCNYGYDLNWIEQSVKKLQPVAMRMELRQGINSCSIINDSYNSDLHSLSIALDFLSEQVQNQNTRLILSDILQTGISEDKLYKEVAFLVKAKKLTFFVGIGPAVSRQASKFSDIESEFYPDTEAFLKKFDFSALYNEAILIKGARPFGFEKISNLLQQKDHQTILEINLDALLHNYKVYKSLLKPKTKIMGMVKAFSYGSGSYEIASALSKQNCDYLAVAYADEGKELRDHGILLPIIVMNPEIQSLDTLHLYNLQPEIYSLNLFERIANSSKLFPGVSENNPFPVHIKLDTGMHRLGFMKNEIDELLQLIKNNPHIKIESIFSHLAASDMPEYDDFTKQQLEAFEILSQKIMKELRHPIIRHICNSAAISRFPEAHYNMVRLGIGLYGIDSGNKVNKLLKNVSSFKSVVSQVKEIKKGESIGYSRAAIAKENVKIAIIPVGYADGLSRVLGNGKATFIINNKAVKTIGNICMDMCMVDISKVNVREGDEVIIFGEEHPLTKLAEDLNTIPYEVLTSISHRVKRIYYRD